MSKSNIPGVGFRQRKGVSMTFFDMDRYATSMNFVTAPLSETRKANLPERNGVISWGDNNTLPQEMVRDIEACGVLSGGIDGKGRFGLGRGIMPFKRISVNKDGSEDLEPVLDDEIEEWQLDNALFHSELGWFKDLTGMGQDLARFKFTKDGKKIGIMRRHDVSEFRYLQPAIKNSYPTQIALSADWEHGAQEDMLKIPLFPFYNTLNFIRELKDSQKKNKEFALITRQPGWGRHYYSLPLWMAARKWVEIAKGVPGMKAAMFQNNVRIKYIITIYPEYWTNSYSNWDSMEEKDQLARREELYDQIDDYLTGADNAYKSIYVDGYVNQFSHERVAGIEIKTIDDPTRNGELLPDSAAANSEILFALMMNPALMGAHSPGGGYGGGSGSGSDIREAAMVQVMIQEFERQSIARKMDIVSYINGWKKRHKNLVWRFPGLVLTTLDKGTSTESVVNGGTLNQ